MDDFKLVKQIPLKTGQFLKIWEKPSFRDEFNYKISYSNDDLLLMSQTYNHRYLNIKPIYKLVRAIQIILDHFSISHDIVYEAFSSEERLNWVFIPNDEWDKIPKNIPSKKDTELEEAFFRISRLSNASVKAEARMKSIKDYVASYADMKVNSVSDFVKLMNPLFSQYGFDYYEVMKTFLDITSSPTLLKNADYRTAISSFVNAFYAENLSEEQLNGTVGELPMQNLGEMRISHCYKFTKTVQKIIGIPIKNVEYSEYLMGLTVLDFRKFVSMDELKLRKTTPVNHAIAYTQRCIVPPMPDIELWNGAFKAYTAAFNLFKNFADSKHNEYMRIGDFHTKIISMKNYPHCMNLLAEFFENSIGKFNTVSKMKGSVNIMLNRGRWSTWLAGSTEVDYVVGILYEKTGVNALQIIKDVAVSEKGALTVTQWESFINDYETYKDAPVSWWVSLL